MDQKSTALKKPVDPVDWGKFASTKPRYAYSIFCGVLEYSKCIKEEVNAAKKAGFMDWEIHVKRGKKTSEEIIKDFSDYYYESFVNTIFCDTNSSEPKGSNSDSAKGITRLSFKFKINEKRSITNKKKDPEKADSEKVFKIQFEYLDLFFFPDGIVFYCFKCDLTNFSFNDITLINSYIRRNSEVKGNGMEFLYDKLSFLGVADETKNDSLSFGNKLKVFLYNKLSFLRVADKTKDDSLSFGNKLKVFIIVEHAEVLNKEDENMLLYDFGACAPIGTAYGNFPKSEPSEEFFNKILEKNKISVYNNWSALALFDTFTGLFQEGALGDNFNWESGYFNLLYLESLYVKNHLFKINKVFCEKGVNHQKLDDELFEFVKLYSPSHISFNFLPTIIFNKIRYSLAINDELTLLKEGIERATVKSKEKSDKMINDMLKVIALLAVFSVIWDLSEWINKLFSGSTFSYNLLSASLTAIVLLIIVFFLIKKKKKRL